MPQLGPAMLQLYWTQEMNLLLDLVLIVHCL
jgi:hypothetical protein